ncbi:MAG: NCS2 family permease [Bifidobacteriaceae bacterium]|jgi:AGZA family xanthine/uracil permease-like MFS transporter|nr:NCS2 family permease [Bifidobacteriaceae bacterium]
MSSTTSSLKAPSAGRFDRFFQISERGSTVWQEIRGGLVTFFTMCYIVVLNPMILTSAPSGSGAFLGGFTGAPEGLAESGVPAQAAAATALVAGVMCLTMGLVANFPLAMAAGLGINAMVAFGIAVLPGMTYADAMGLIVIEGIIILILVLTGFRVAVFRAVPPVLKIAISVGIGLFIALIGLFDAGFVSIPVSQATPLELGVGGSLGTWPVLVFAVGLIIAIVLLVRKVKGAILIAIVSSTVLAFVVEAIAHPQWHLSAPRIDSVVQMPDLSLIGQFSLFGAFGKLSVVTVILLVFTLLLADFFDTMGTMVAVGAEGGLLDKDGNPPRTKQILIVDSLGAVAGGAGGISSNTAYIESASGVGDGARTGLASVVTGLAFLASMFVAPLVSAVPYEAATPALVAVGFLMMTQVAGIDWSDWEISIPAFLTIVLMPFAYSITVGIGAGFISFVVLKIAKGKAKAVHPLMWVASVLFVVYFAIAPIKSLLGAG